jgi:hypothetical protein
MDSVSPPHYERGKRLKPRYCTPQSGPIDENQQQMKTLKRTAALDPTRLSLDTIKGQGELAALEQGGGQLPRRAADAPAG